MIVLGFVPLSALILGYTFLLKMMSHMQSRLGPMDPGGFHGWYQLIGDGLKFMQKEDIMPAEADRRVFALAPAVVVLSTFLVFVVIPAGPRLVVEPLDVGVFYALAVSSLSVIGVLMAGWASSNKFALMGALRAAAQLIAYELPARARGRRRGGAGRHDEPPGHRALPAARRRSSAGAGIGRPFILTQFVGFALFMVAAQAELTQPPFDMPVAESELVAGYMVEYTGFRFLFFFIGEFGTAFAFSALAATLFLGGWSVPWVHGVAADWLGPAGAVRQGDVRRLLDVLGSLHLPPVARGSAAGARVEVADPDRARQHPRHRRARRWRSDEWRSGGGRMKREIKGMFTGLGVTFKTMMKPTVTVQYPHEREDPPTRARGVIALKEENCTVCMLCARQCPDWCIYIEGHKEQRPPRREGGRPRSVSVLDRFDIDYALCMYCGICVEVCPFDALVLEPRVRVLRVAHREPSPRQGQARRVDGDRARARAARTGRRSQGQEVTTTPRTGVSVPRIRMRSDAGWWRGGGER